MQNALETFTEGDKAPVSLLEMKKLEIEKLERAYKG